MTDLHRVLTEATDHVRSPDLAGRALAGAARRRTRRTTLVDAPRRASPLPEQVEPPTDPPSLVDQPLADVVLAWPEQGAVRLGGYGERFVTRFSQVAYVGNPGPGDMGVMKGGPVVTDPTTGEVLAFAPIRDPEGVYSDNVNLTPLGFLDGDTVLLLVSPMDYRTMDIGEGRTHLVTWDHVTGDFGLVASGDAGMRGIAVAPALLEG